MVAKPNLTGVPGDASDVSAVGDERTLLRKESEEKFLPGGGRVDDGLARSSAGEFDGGLGPRVLSCATAEFSVEVGEEKLNALLELNSACIGEV